MCTNKRCHAALESQKNTVAPDVPEGKKTKKKNKLWPRNTDLTEQIRSITFPTRWRILYLTAWGGRCLLRSTWSLLLYPNIQRRFLPPWLVQESCVDEKGSSLNFSSAFFWDGGWLRTNDMSCRKLLEPDTSMCSPHLWFKISSEEFTHLTPPPPFRVFETMQKRNKCAFLSLTLGP